MAIFASERAGAGLVELLDQLRDDERVTITRHGQPIAVLTPIRAETDKAAHRRAALGAMRDLQAQCHGKVSMDEIDAEIEAVRRERRR